MGIPVLLVATTTTWFGTARIPKVLAAAGFDVSLLTPRHSLSEASRFIARIGYLGTIRHGCSGLKRSPRWSARRRRAS